MEVEELPLEVEEAFLLEVEEHQKKEVEELQRLVGAFLLVVQEVEGSFLGEVEELLQEEVEQSFLGSFLEEVGQSFLPPPRTCLSWPCWASEKLL